jgi:hypothetical protein
MCELLYDNEPVTLKIKTLELEERLKMDQLSKIDLHSLPSLFFQQVYATRQKIFNSKILPIIN